MAKKAAKRKSSRKGKTSTKARRSAARAKPASRKRKASKKARRSAVRATAVRATVAGTVWSPNHLACVNTWGFLRFEKQLKGDFASSGAVKMNELAFWNPASSPAARRLEAQFLAGKFDSFFRKALLATFETGQDFAKAIAAMSDTLVDSAKTVSDLAMVNDAIYRFRGEV